MSTATALVPRHVPGEATYLHVPPGRIGSHGDTVCEVAEMMRRPLEPHQVAAVDAINAYGPGGTWLTLEAAVVGPRQTTGKTAAIILPSVLADLFTWREPAGVAWTSHRMKTTRETFGDLLEIIEGSEEFSRRVRKVSNTDSDEYVEFTNRSKIEFMARSPGVARGLGRRVVVIDEALYFTTGMAGDLLPVMVSQRNPRVLYASSAPKSTSGHLQNLVARGRAADPTLVYVEYRCPGSLEDAGCAAAQCTHDRTSVGCKLDDETLWRYGSPGLVSGRVSVSVVRALRATLEPLEFAREMLGWEETSDEADVIDLATWRRQVDAQSRVVPRSRPVLTFDVALDRRSAAVGLAGRRVGGGVHLGLIDHRRGTDWLVARLAALVQHDPVAIVLDGSSPAMAQLPALTARGLTVRSATNPTGLIIVASVAETAQALGGLVDALGADTPDVWHRGDELVEAAWRSAMSRSVGDGATALGRKASGGDITPATVLALAHWGLAVHGEADYDLAESFG